MAWFALLMDPVTRELWVTAGGSNTREGIEDYAEAFHAPTIGYLDMPGVGINDEMHHPLWGMRHYVPDDIEVRGAYSYDKGLTE